MNCRSYKDFKLLKHAMKIVEKVLEKRLQDTVNLDELQFGIMLKKGTVDALLLLK